MNDGGPAFPVYTYDFTDGNGQVVRATDYGMTLRDYFAAAALQGELASYSTHDSAIAAAEAQIKQGYKTSEEYVAATAYKIADAMLVERERNK